MRLSGLQRAMDASRNQEAAYNAFKIALLSGANSARRQWMTGREFEWLQGQIALLLWHGGDDPVPFNYAEIQKPTHQSTFILTPSGAKPKPEPNPKPSDVSRLSYKEYVEYRPGKKKIAMSSQGMTVGEYNIWRDQTETSNLTPYVHQEYPKMVYKGSESKVVENAHEHQSARAAGYFNADEVFGK